MELNNRQKLLEICAIGAFNSPNEEKLITYLAETGNFESEKIYNDIGAECALLYVSFCNDYQNQQNEKKLKEHLGGLE